MRAIAVLLFLTVCAYIGAGFYEGLADDMQTVRAESAAVTESIGLYGVAVRREQQLCSPTAQILPVNGKRYPSGAAICMAGDGSCVYSPAPATFYESFDGFEYLDPDMLFPFGSNTFSELLSSESEKGRHCLGRLLLDNIWYYAAEVTVGLAPSAGQSCSLLFEDIGRECEGLVWAVCRDRDKEYVLLRINGGDEQLMSLRHCSAKLILCEYKGLKIPKNAVCTDNNGKKYIRVLAAGLVETRTVDIIYTGDDFCLVKQSWSWDALREGESVLINREITDEGLVLG